ncbi:hypothetical protein [Parasphingopyxis marina]|uniref:Uncharacterized protein n=1 Tax=Parasphingopyxis marina TaxID=2761622 RepID=A0A842I0M4_9SPHN|nr:hypothetical protein [Parasphingopyxis marina]MBC2778397.1 hypothetical protein [Parasphingopyxis marina]
MRAFFAAIIAAFALIATPAAAQSDTIDFGFAPPIGSTLSYEIVRASALGERRAGMRFVRDYRFERDSGGYLLWVELRSAEPLDAGDNAGLMEAIAAPMIGVRYAIEIGPNGTPGAIRDQRGVWQRVLEGVALIGGYYAGNDDFSDAEREQMAAIIAEMQNKGEAGQRETLLVVVRDMLALAGQSVRAEIAGDIEAGPMPVAAAMTARIVSDDLARVELDASSPGTDGTGVRESVVYRAAPSSGLVHRMERTRIIASEDGAAEDAYRETHSLRLLHEMRDTAAVADGVQ